MKTQLIASSLDEVWVKLDNYFTEKGVVTNYDFVIEYGNSKTEVSISSSLGGAAEGGYELTTLTATLVDHIDFKFSAGPRDILSDIGILFGMQHIDTGYPEFDKNVILKSNDVALAKRIFEDDDARLIFQNLSGFTFKTVHNEKNNQHTLEFEIQFALTNPEVLYEVYTVFYHALTLLNPQPAGKKEPEAAK